MNALGFAGLLLSILLAACTALVSRQDTPSPPHIEELSPDSGWAGPDYPIELLIRGTGFTETGNEVRFGPVTLHDVPSRQGVIRLDVPKEVRTASEVPPMVLLPDEYEVQVINRRGSSNIVIFRLTRAGS